MLEVLDSDRSRFAREDASESPLRRSTKEASESALAWPAGVFFGELAALLGGVLKGETLWSVSSIGLGSGAVSPWVCCARFAGFTGTFGFPARLTGGGPFDFCAVGCGTEVRGTLLLTVVGGLTGSVSIRNALIRCSSAGVVDRLRFRE